MKVYKKNLPDGIKKMFALEKGVKVKYLNKKYYDKKKNKIRLAWQEIFCYNHLVLLAG